MDRNTGLVLLLYCHNTLITSLLDAYKSAIIYHKSFCICSCNWRRVVPGLLCKNAKHFSTMPKRVLNDANTFEV